MESHLLHFVAFLSLAVAAVSRADQSSEVYWKTMLPNTPMPKAVKELLQTDMKKEKIASVHIGGRNWYRSAASEEELHRDPSVGLFFLEKDLLPGRKMKLHFTVRTAKSAFLPRQSSDAIPFTSKNLTDVMEKLFVEPQSLGAEAMKQTIKLCEAPSLEGEQTFCATSLESMVDFCLSKLGNQVQPMSTEIDKEETVSQIYTIGAGVKKMGGESSIVCHRRTYAYAVFYCHETKSTKAYRVVMVGADGTKATTVAVCHTDTSKWNPKHLAFHVLKVKPGTVPVCHFLPEDSVLWTSS